MLDRRLRARISSSGFCSSFTVQPSLAVGLIRLAYGLATGRMRARWILRRAGSLTRRRPAGHTASIGLVGRRPLHEKAVSGRRPVAVAEPAHRLDRLGISGRAQLSPQVADVELDLVARGGVGVAPYELEQLLVREDLPRVAHERRQEPELLRPRAQLLPPR